MFDYVYVITNIRLKVVCKECYIIQWTCFCQTWIKIHSELKMIIQISVFGYEGRKHENNEVMVAPIDWSDTLTKPKRIKYLAIMLCGKDLGCRSTMTDHIWVKSRTSVLNVGDH
jgi:hypothetical protein